MVLLPVGLPLLPLLLLLLLLVVLTLSQRWHLIARSIRREGGRGGGRWDAGQSARQA